MKQLFCSVTIFIVSRLLIHMYDRDYNVFIMI